jgi:ATP-binding cassette subfamily B protein
MKLAFAFMPATLLGTLPVSVYLTSKGSISVSEMALAVMLAMSMVISMAKIEVFSESVRQMAYTVNEIQGLFEISTLKEPDVSKVPNGYSVELNDVRFSYDKDGEEVLHGINLHIPEGSYTALVGPSGGGKSTVAKLIARFWDVSDGSIKIGGVDIKDIRISDLANYVSFVTQDNFLFQCSLLENIRLGNPDATDEEVKAAARAACCEDFILKLPEGYDTSAGEAGKKLSGGERQRIAIARMMLKNAPIVILDEATAFTDPENEDKLQQSIAALTKGKTLLVIAHRLSTIKGADNIVVLDKGRITAMGNQEELLSSCALYERMWQAHIGARNWAAGSKAQDLSAIEVLAK